MKKQEEQQEDKQEPVCIHGKPIRTQCDECDNTILAARRRLKLQGKIR